ncbi:PLASMODESMATA CALLOSE-BINDING PROTEIN 3-like [Alnus glutinosa]|uniref:PLASMODESMATA CALLOSE-BINDING PROTEIN 3-like n=1 Tax=Alnus glutinosa TaxID=3517 RepID=UPI002D798E4F|nr:PLASMODESMATA CALLOSE-BINDING PROTEIN 3-like [Alnus glutinosa]
MAVLVYLVLFLALTGHSSATYCFCKDGLSDQALQKTLDYACGAGADCSPILQSGACYQPNTVKNHCDYAVNSYFQRKNQGQGTCDFSGTASPSQTAPTVASASCVYPASASQAGTGTTTTNTSTTPPSTTTPTTGTPTTTTGSGIGIPPPPGLITGISPTGTTTTTGIDGTGEGAALTRGTGIFFSLALTLWSLLLWG